MNIQELFSLAGRVALVTGATHGLGMAVATALAEAGATLVVNGHSPDRLEQALKTYREKGIDAKGYLFDVTDEQAVIEFVGRIEREVGPVDILVNNAGIIKRIPALDMTLPEWNEVITTDLTSPFLMSGDRVGEIQHSGQWHRARLFCYGTDGADPSERQSVQ